MKTKKTFLKIVSLVVVIILGIAAFFYFSREAGANYIADYITEEIHITLPKSETFEVTSTAKGDNQLKIARLGDEVFTFYLDNSGCTDPKVRGNDKTMRLIHIRNNGEYVVFDSIPVWMHGNVLVDEQSNRIYYTTYEEEYDNYNYYGLVKIYAYSYENGTITRIAEETLADDKIIMGEANPRVGADIDQDGNIAVAFGNYSATMFVYVYDKINDTWTKHSIGYNDTYMQDCNLYPYVRIQGVDCIKVAANRDTSIDENGRLYINGGRDYTRYFTYDGNNWENFIIADVRDLDPEGVKGLLATPIDLYIDNDKNTYVITNELNNFHYYRINPEGVKTEIELIKLKKKISIEFIRILTVNDKKYYVVSGNAMKGFKKTGYIELYEYDTHKLVYRNNSICNIPYLFINKKNDNGFIDLMIISRDSDYAENSDTHYIRLKIKN
jgi:hypothetical protein